MTNKKSAQCSNKQENHAVARKPRDDAAVLFDLKFADNIHYKFRSSQGSKARFHSSKHTGTKQRLTQNDHSRSLKITCFGISGKEINSIVLRLRHIDLEFTLHLQVPK